MESDVTKMINESVEKTKKKLFTKWTGSKFECIRQLSTTEKGTWGEELTKMILKSIGCEAEIINGGKGDYDILAVTTNGKVLKIEHKLATEDVNNKFQFNGIKKDIDYDVVICLGVRPESLEYYFLTKNDAQKLTVAMVKDTNDTFKFTTTSNGDTMYEVENFKSMMERIESVV